MRYSPHIELADGNIIPQIGLGTWKLKGEECVRAVSDALKIGYRHIDTADAYGNHEAVAQAIQESAIPRDEIFLTTKVWRDQLQYEDVLGSAKRFLKELQVTYIDLLLIHWPNDQIPVTETLDAFKTLKEKGLIKSIGVSNFPQALLEEIQAESDVKIVNNQIEEHIELIQEELINYCFTHNISVTAYSPLAQGSATSNSVLQSIAEAHGKTASQIALHYLVLKGMIVVPKSGSKDHIQENFEIFDIELSKEEFAQIEKLNTGTRTINPSFSPW